MSVEEQAPERQLTLAEFEEMFADFLNGAISLAQLRQCMVDVINNDPDALPTVQEQVDSAMYAGRLPEQTWENLIAEIDHLVSENTPTEWSEETTITPEADEAPLLDPSDDGPMLFDEEPVEPPVLIETVDTPEATPTPAAPAARAPAESVAQTETTHPMPDTTDLPPGTVLEDRYVLVSRTEHGSMGTVYKALDRKEKEAGAEDPWVAIKLITAEFGKHTAAVDTLRNEAEIGCRLNHPNIARSHALHEDGEHLFISMEWLDGESLSQLLDRKRPHTLPRDQALKIIEGLSTGLAYAHSQGVVHADIKPANVFLTQSGEVKLLDFGIARANDGMPLTGGLVAKTPAYASCEVLEGDNPGFQDDLFSLAAVAYRVLTGQRPFGSATSLEAEEENREPVPVPGLSPQQWRALNTALAWRRENRSADVQSFLTEFFGEEEIVLSSPEPAVAATAPTPKPAPIAASSAAVNQDQAAAPVATVPEIQPEPTVETAISADIGDAAAALEDHDDESGAGWLRPALAACVVGAAVAAGWTMFGSGESPAPTGNAGKTEVVAAVPEPEPVGTEASAPAAVIEPETEQAVAQARISDGPAGEELMLFMPGTGIPTTDDLGADEAPSSAAGTAVAAEQAAAATADIADADPAARTAALEEPAGEPTAVPEARPQTEPEPTVSTAAPERVVDTVDSAARNEVSRTAAATGLATGAAAAAPVNQAVKAAPSVARQAPAQAEAAEPAAAEPARQNSARQDSAIKEAAPQQAAASPAESSDNEPPAAEVDSVSAPAEAMLASTMSMAMVSPDSTQRAVEPELDTVPIPEPVKPKEPDAYGPPPELAPPKIEEVLMSSLKLKRFVEPKFPKRARDKGLSGWVDLRFVVNSEGETDEIEVLDSQPGGTFDEAAVAAVERWRFKPRRVDGEAVPSRTGIRLRFE